MHFYLASPAVAVDVGGYGGGGGGYAGYSNSWNQGPGAWGGPPAGAGPGAWNQPGGGSYGSDGYGKLSSLGDCCYQLQ